MRRGCDQDGGSSGHPEDEVGEGWKQKREEATAVLQIMMMMGRWRRDCGGGVEAER